MSGSKAAEEYSTWGKNKDQGIRELKAAPEAGSVILALALAPTSLFRIPPIY